MADGKINHRTLCCDVGSGSVRVAVFQFNNGTLDPRPLAGTTRPLAIHNPQSGHYEQRTEEIWSAFCSAAKQCLLEVPSIHSIGFSATCSMVIVEENSVENDVIMWMDHRAREEARLINETNHLVLEQFGGICSLEFSLAKLLWLHRHQPDRFRRAKAFMELPDWLSYRCSNWWNHPEHCPRSLCSVVCKWGFDAVHHRWPKDLFEKLGFDHWDSLHRRIGTNVLNPGMAMGYLGRQASIDIGLESDNEPITVAASLIDAHSGTLSMLTISGHYEDYLCMISGTSTCHLMLSKTPSPARGIWGPYQDAIIPGYYLGEAGQSATGKLIEHIIVNDDHEKADDWKEIVDKLNQELNRKNFQHQCSLIMNPTYHGNRSPMADPRLKGAIYGLTLDRCSLLDQYVATVESLAYETKLIVEKWSETKPISGVIVSGGLTKNPFYLQIHADVLGQELRTYDVDHMLAGASIIASVAATNADPDRLSEIFASIRFGETEIRTFKPQTSTALYHRKKFRCYQKLLQASIEIEDILMDFN